MTTTTKTEAQEPASAPTPDDPVIAQLEKEKKIAELEKAIADAKKAKREAELPSTETKGAAGEVTVDEKGGYYAELMAYGTLAEAAVKIASKVKPSDGVTAIVVTDQMDLSLKAQAWHLIRGRLDDFDQRFKVLEAAADIKKPEDLVVKPEGLGMMVAAVPALLGGIADIAAFFRVDVETKGRTMTLAKNALLAEVAAALKTQANWSQVYLPGLQVHRAGTLVKKLDELSTARAAAVERKRKLEELFKPEMDELEALKEQLVAMRAELAEMEKVKPPDPKAIAEQKKKIEARESEEARQEHLVGAWEKLAADFDALFSTWDTYLKLLTEGTAEKPSPIESLAAVDILQSLPDADRLHIEVTSGGGEVHLTKNPWTSGRISYLGGSVCTYFWVDKDGAYKGSGTTRLWKGRSFKPRELTSATSGEP